MTKITTANPSRTVVTIGLCFMVALMEGLDLQAAGIAAVGMAQAFALDKMQMGWIFQRRDPRPAARRAGGQHAGGPPRA